MSYPENHAEPLHLSSICQPQTTPRGSTNSIVEHSGEVVVHDANGSAMFSSYAYLSTALPAPTYVATSIEEPVNTAIARVGYSSFVPNICLPYSLSDSPSHLTSADPLDAQEFDRLMTLDDKQRIIFKQCGADPDVQDAVLCILHSDEYRTQHSLPWPLASRLFELIPYRIQQGECVKSGKGCRGAPEFYECRWRDCHERMRRRLHALEHVHNHVGIRPFICPACQKGFVRKNELVKHSPCKANRKASVLVSYVPPSKTKHESQVDAASFWHASAASFTVAQQEGPIASPTSQYHPGWYRLPYR